MNRFHAIEHHHFHLDFLNHIPSDVHHNKSCVDLIALYEKAIAAERVLVYKTWRSTYLMQMKSEFKLIRKHVWWIKFELSHFPSSDEDEIDAEVYLFPDRLRSIEYIANLQNPRFFVEIKKYMKLLTSKATLSRLNKQGVRLKDYIYPILDGIENIEVLQKKEEEKWRSVHGDNSRVLRVQRNRVDGMYKELFQLLVKHSISFPRIYHKKTEKELLAIRRTLPKEYRRRNRW